MLAIMDRDLSARMVFSVPWVAPAPDVTFGVEAEEEPLRSWLDAIVRALNGVALWLHPGQDRARYHAASVIASNYVVTAIADRPMIRSGRGNAYGCGFSRAESPDAIARGLAGMITAQAEKAGPVSVSVALTRAGLSLWSSGPRRNKAPPTIAPPAKMAAIHQNAVS